jgi:hypothetical protein
MQRYGSVTGLPATVPDLCLLPPHVVQTLCVYPLLCLTWWDETALYVRCVVQFHRFSCHLTCTFDGSEHATWFVFYYRGMHMD